MAVNVPMPDLPGNSLLKGVNTGSSMFTNLMHPILEREKQRQLEQHFQEQLKLSKAAAGRAAQAAADAHKKMDPMYEIQQLQRVMQAFNGGGNTLQGQGMQQQSMPTQEQGQGMGMFTPEGLGQAQEQAFQQPLQASNAPAQNGLDMEVIKNSPILRGYFKKHFGIDPAAGEHNILHGPARDASDLAKLKKEAGENSEVYQNAKSQYDASLDAKKDLRDLRARTKAGLKAGEKEFFDPQSGIPLGKEIPLTAKERESEEGNILFNEFYPIAYKGAAPFSGEGSVRRLEQAASNYKTDPKARKLIDNLLLSDKVMAATIVNEASTLRAGKQNQTYNQLKESLSAQDIPKVIKKLVKEYQLPPGAMLHASMRYQKLLSDARKKARKSTPATQKLFYNPEMQAQYEAQQNESMTPAEGSKVINGITYYPDGQGGWEHD